MAIAPALHNEPARQGGCTAIEQRKIESLLCLDEHVRGVVGKFPTRRAKHTTVTSENKLTSLVKPACILHAYGRLRGVTHPLDRLQIVDHVRAPAGNLIPIKDHPSVGVKFRHDACPHLKVVTLHAAREVLRAEGQARPVEDKID